MSDRETEILVKPEIDQQGLNKTLAGIDSLLAKVKQAQQENQDILASTQLSFGEKFVGGIEDGIASMDKLVDKAKDFGSGLASGAQKGFSFIAGEVLDFGSGLSDAIEKNIKKVAQIGAALIGALSASSFAFTNRFAGVDPQANSQQKAQNLLQRALEDLGSVASRIVTPALEGLATIVENVAKFLDKTFPKDKENFVSKFFNETIPNAEKTFVTLIGTVELLAKKFETDMQVGLDKLVTDVKSVGLLIQDGFGKIFNALINAVADIVDKFSLLVPNASLVSMGLRSQIDQNAVTGANGKTGYEQQIDKLQEDQRTRAKTSYENLAKTASDTAKRVDEATKAIDLFNSSAKASIGSLTGSIGKAEVEAFINRNRDIAKADKALADGETQAKAQANKQLLSLETQYGKDRAKQLTENAKEEQSLVENYNNDKLKAQEDFAANEQQIEEESQAKRAQNLAAHQLTLKELAARGDVAAFVEEQRRFALENQQETEQEARDKNKRQQEFNRQQAEKDRQFAIDLQKLQDQNEERLKQLDENYATQKQQIEDALQDQLSALKTFHDEQVREIDRAFAQQLANLQSNLAGLNDQQNAYYQTESANLAQFIATQKAYLQDLYNTAPGQTGTTGGVSTLDLGGLGAGTQTSGNTFITIESGAVQNTVGDIATQSQLTQVQDNIVGGLAAALSNQSTTGGSGLALSFR